jgi:hypothetical protein
MRRRERIKEMKILEAARGGAPRNPSQPGGFTTDHLFGVKFFSHSAGIF